MNEEMKEKAQSGGVYFDVHDNEHVVINPNLTEMNVTHHHYHEDRNVGGLSIDEGDRLSYFIPNTKLREQVKTMLAACTKPHDILETVLPVLRGVCALSCETIRGKNFCEAILPHLSGIATPSVENIRQAMKGIK